MVRIGYTPSVDVGLLAVVRGVKPTHEEPDNDTDKGPVLGRYCGNVQGLMRSIVLQENISNRCSLCGILVDRLFSNARLIAKSGGRNVELTFEGAVESRL